jgi:dTDP-4-amino-4,6-dideoxygalactose transaminase
LHITLTTNSQSNSLNYSSIEEQPVDWKIQLFKLNYDEQEVEAVVRVVRGGWLTMGEQTKEFESRFSKMLGEGSEAVAVSSGTAALHMALLALGIGPGDEVIVSSLTFIAAVNVVRLVGARAVLADCRSVEDWNIDAADVERKVTSKTRAVIAVHYAGYPCGMDELEKVCHRRSIGLVEDSAHAIGATWRGRQCGTFGRIGCFSFFTNKNLSVGEGGMFVSGEQALTRRGRMLRSHGMSTLTMDRHEGRAISYDVLEPGLNYRIDEMRAALGIVQLERLADANRRRGALVAMYHEQLDRVSAVSIPFRQIGPDVIPCYHIYPILLDTGVDRNKVIGALRERGVQSSIHYPAIQQFSAYKDLDLGVTPIANDISSRELTLPLYPGMMASDIGMVCDALKAALA